MSTEKQILGLVVILGAAALIGLVHWLCNRLGK
jgi:hypothetical protein